jgi:hypothetical protein
MHSQSRPQPAVPSNQFRELEIAVCCNWAIFAAWSAGLDNEIVIVWL